MLNGTTQFLAQLSQEISNLSQADPRNQDLLSLHTAVFWEFLGHTVDPSYLIQALNLYKTLNMSLAKERANQLLNLPIFPFWSPPVAPAVVPTELEKKPDPQIKKYPKTISPKAALAAKRAKVLRESQATTQTDSASSRSLNALKSAPAVKAATTGNLKAERKAHRIAITKAKQEQQKIENAMTILAYIQTFLAQYPNTWLTRKEIAEYNRIAPLKVKEAIEFLIQENFILENNKDYIPFVITPKGNAALANQVKTAKPSQENKMTPLNSGPAKWTFVPFNLEETNLDADSSESASDRSKSPSDFAKELIFTPYKTAPMLSSTSSRQVPEEMVSKASIAFLLNN